MPINPLIERDPVQSVAHYLTTSQARDKVQRGQIIDACIDAFEDAYPDVPWQFTLTKVHTPARAVVSYRLLVFPV